MSQPKLEPMSRLLVLGKPDLEKRMVPAALSSTEPVPRQFGIEVLEHSSRAIDMSRAADSLPLLVNHDLKSLPIGRVRNIRLDGDKLRGDLHFSEATQASRDAWALVQDGTLGDVSIQYLPNKIDPPAKRGGAHIVSSWTPFEASAVSVPFDATVGIGRSMQEGTTMPEENTTAPTVPATPEPAGNPAVIPTASRRAGIDEGQLIERARVTAIDDLAANFPANPAVIDLAAIAKRDGWGEDAFKTRMIEAMSPGATPSAVPLAHPVYSPRVAPGEDDGEKFARGLREAMNLRAGNLNGDDARRARTENELSGYSLIEIGRRMLERSGLSTRGMTPIDVAGNMLTRAINPGTANLDTTDFPSLLENVMNKSLFRGFEEAPVTWNIFCGTGSSSDFKQGSRPGVSQFTSLSTVAENASATDGIVNDKTEKFQVETYSKLFSVTRQTLVNDDLGGLGDIANKMGQAAARTVDEQVYAFIIANGVMNEDSVALFDAATHNNLDASAGDPSTAAITAARVAMGRQVDTNGIVLGISPQYMVVPLELEEAMLVLRTTTVDPDAQNVTRNNVYQQTWQPVSTPRLVDTNDWYMFSGQGQHIDVMFLNGSQAPMMAREEGWSVLAAHWRVVLDFDVMAVDWRGAWKATQV